MTVVIEERKKNEAVSTSSSQFANMEDTAPMNLAEQGEGALGHHYRALS